MANILLGDDDEELTQLLQEYLHNHGIQGDCVHDGEAVIERLKSAMHDSAPYDLLVLDIMMPKIDGLSVLRQLPAISDIPVIMLTAKGEEIDRIIGLELGADDYITKPFNTREVVARVKAVLRRSGQVTVRSAERLNYPDLMIDLSEYKVVAFGKNVTFTAKEMELLWCLASNPGLVFSRNQLLETIWGYTYYGDTRTVDTHIKRVRHKLDIPKDSAWDITTVWGVGYKFEVR